MVIEMGIGSVEVGAASEWHEERLQRGRAGEGADTDAGGRLPSYAIAPVRT